MQNQKQSQRRPPEDRRPLQIQRHSQQQEQKSRRDADATKTKCNGKVKSDVDGNCARRRLTKTLEFRRAGGLGLQFFGFLYEGEEALGADAEIYRGFGVLGSLGLLDAALEVGNFGFG
jgi:hypothetical protein